MTDQILKLKETKKNKSYKLFRIGQFIHIVKDLLCLDVLGIYRIPCMCASLYIGQTGRSVSVHKKEHQWCLRLVHVEQAALAKHAWVIGHKILFEDTIPLCNVLSYDNRIVRAIGNLAGRESAQYRRQGKVEQCLSACA